MALKLDPVRLLIADDVGIGKTVEALLVARELLDQGDANGLAVLCPPHLAEQWQAEMRDKFHLDAELVLAGTAARLERGLRVGESLFERYPITVVSPDYIKSDRRRDDFIRACPELVIVDEAHTCADASAGRGQPPSALPARLEARREPGPAPDPRHRHPALRQGGRLPRSGLVPRPDIPRSSTTTSTDERVRGERRRLARHLVQRRRGDIVHYLGETRFPDREVREETYDLSAAYRALFKQIFEYGRETVGDRAEGSEQRSACAGGRSSGSCARSPPARRPRPRRSTPAPELIETKTLKDADEIGRRDRSTAPTTRAPRAPTCRRRAGRRRVPRADRRALNELARQAARRCSDDERPEAAAGHEARRRSCSTTATTRSSSAPSSHRRLRRRAAPREAAEGRRGDRRHRPHPRRRTRAARARARRRRPRGCWSPPTASARASTSRTTSTPSSTTTSPGTRPATSSARAASTATASPSPTVRVLTYFGRNNPIDGIVLDVLLRKHRASSDRSASPSRSRSARARSSTRSSRGSSCAADDEQLSLFEHARARRETGQLCIDEWEAAADREKRSRTIFAQQTINVDEVAASSRRPRRDRLWRPTSSRFVTAALRAAGATVSAATPSHDRPARHAARPARRARPPRATSSEPASSSPFATRSSTSRAPTRSSRRSPATSPTRRSTRSASRSPRAAARSAPTPSRRARRCCSSASASTSSRSRGDDDTRQLAEEMRLLAFEGAPTPDVARRRARGAAARRRPVRQRRARAGARVRRRGRRRVRHARARARQLADSRRAERCSTPTAGPRRRPAEGRPLRRRAAAAGRRARRLRPAPEA